mgnify:CR=1 FL=1
MKNKKKNSRLNNIMYEFGDMMGIGTTNKKRNNKMNIAVPVMTGIVSTIAVGRLIKKSK